MKKYLFSLLIPVIVFLNRCAGGIKAQKGTAVGTGVGAGIGAILGQAIGGNNTEATLLGAGVGAIIGGLTGNQVIAYMDHQEQELRMALTASEAASVRRLKEMVLVSEEAGEQSVMDILTATFKSDVLFDFDSAILKPGAYSELDRVAVILKKYAKTKIRVEGHTCSKGAEKYNVQLSEKMAVVVKNTLVQQGVNESRIESVGLGELQPVSLNDVMNRRVVIVIKPFVKAVG